jgi:hypothetical protein
MVRFMSKLLETVPIDHNGKRLRVPADQVPLATLDARIEKLAGGKRRPIAKHCSGCGSGAAGG